MTTSDSAPWSLEKLRRWLIKAGMPAISTLKQYVEILPRYLTLRFISTKQDTVVVAGRVPDADASKLLPIVKTLENSFAKVRADNPGFRISVTGLSVIAARNSATMIGKLSIGLTLEFLFVAAFMGAAFRSFVVMFAAICREYSLSSRRVRSSRRRDKACNLRASWG
jgi:uncharacterized protein